MVRGLGPFEADGGHRYLRLGRAVAAFLRAQGRDPEAWAELDVAAFVAHHAATPRHAIDACCNLSAILPWLVGGDRLSTAQAGRLWTQLLDVCPPDRPAHAYLRRGLDEFGTVGVN